MKWIKPILSISFLVGLVLWIATLVFPSPEKQIRIALNKLAETASFTAAEKPLARLAAINAIPTFFHTNAVLHISNGGFSRNLNGKNEIREAVAGARTIAQSLKVQLTDPQIELGNKPGNKPGNKLKNKLERVDEATVTVTATVYVDNDPNPQLQILRLTMVRSGRKWLIKRLDPLDLGDL